jgi:trans-aconitate methyltransferase
MDTNELRRTWEAQQSLHAPDRELRFQLMLDHVEHLAGTPERVLDLACGPGSITRRVRSRFPFATVLALDLDPLLLRLARDAFADDDHVTVVRRNLNDADWYQDIEPGFDAVLTATATHWLPRPALAHVYAGIAELLRPGGVFANSDHMPIADPVLRESADALHRHRLESAFAAGAESCDEWYHRAYAGTGLWDERQQTFSHWTGDLLEPAAYHLDLLRRAGFRAAGVVWRRGNDALTIAQRL